MLTFPELMNCKAAQVSVRLICTVLSSTKWRVVSLSQHLYKIIFVRFNP